MVRPQQPLPERPKDDMMIRVILGSERIRALRSAKVQHAAAIAETKVAKGAFEAALRRQQEAEKEVRSAWDAIDAATMA
jgi:hypothetical protein